MDWNGINWWDLVPAALGAVLGALGAALPAFILADRSSKETLRRDQTAREEHDRAVALRLFVKALRISNGATSVWRQVEETVEEAERKGLQEAALWQKLIPFSGLAREPTRFDPEEIAILFAARESDLANGLMLMAERHATNEISLADYSQRRRALSDMLGADMDEESSVGTTRMGLEAYQRVAPRAAELQAAATQIRARLAQDARETLVLIQRLSNALRGRFSNEAGFRIEINSELLKQAGIEPDSS